MKLLPQNSKHFSAEEPHLENLKEDVVLMIVKDKMAKIGDN